MDTENRVYEFSYLVVPTVTEEVIGAKVDALKKLFTDNGAIIIDAEAPQYIGLAYTIIHPVNNKNERINSAYFGWFKINSDPEILSKVKMTLDRDSELVRFLLIKTVAESTLAPKKLSQKREAPRRNKQSFEGLVPETEVVAEEVAETATEEVVADVAETQTEE